MDAILPAPGSGCWWRPWRCSAGPQIAVLQGVRPRPVTTVPRRSVRRSPRGESPTSRAHRAVVVAAREPPNSRKCLQLRSISAQHAKSVPCRACDRAGSIAEKRFIFARERFARTL